MHKPAWVGLTVCEDIEWGRENRIIKIVSGSLLFQCARLSFALSDPPVKTALCTPLRSFRDKDFGMHLASKNVQAVHILVYIRSISGDRIGT